MVIHGLWLAGLGVLSARSTVEKIRPGAAQLLAAVAPFQGFLGALATPLGLWGVVRCLLGVKMVRSAPLKWMSWLGCDLLLCTLGLVLGVSVLRLFVKGPLGATLEQLRARLAPHQARLGLAAIGVGAWTAVIGLL